MALSKQAKKNLDMAMGGEKAANRLMAKIEANQPLDDREKRELEIAMGKKAAAEIAQDLPEQASEDDSAVSDAQDAVDAAQQDVDDAQAALDLDPEDEQLQQDLADAQDALAAAQQALADAQAQSSSHKISKSTEKAMAIGMADNESAAELKAAIEE